MVKNKLNPKLNIKSKSCLTDETTKHKNEKGQLALESVLIVTLLLSLSIFASREMKKRNFIGSLIAEPWKQISGMMSTGNWADSQTALDDNLHPHVNTMTRIGD